MTNVFSVAIDGPSGAGKSTIARAIAEKFGILYLDTGAMYRACAIWFRDAGVDIESRAAAAKNAPNIDIDVKYVSGEQRMFSGGRDVTKEIRLPEVSMLASAVSKYPEIRSRLVDMQRNIAKGTSVVMDGRDIGTKVLPNATVKIYLVADVEARAERRLAELKQKGIAATYEGVLSDMIKRDRDDSTRTFSPLREACDSVRLDTTRLSLDESIEAAVSLVEFKLKNPEGTTSEQNDI